MNIHILNNYLKLVDSTFEGHFDIQLLKEYLEEEILEYDETTEIDEDIIRDEIIEFFKKEDCELSPFNIDDVVSNYSIKHREGLEILNLEELIIYFSYLKRFSIKKTCCELENGNYCSVCGTKLR